MTIISHVFWASAAMIACGLMAGSAYVMVLLTFRLGRGLLFGFRRHR